MTEAEWRACADPKAMVRFLRGRASDRKLRLFLCSSARLVWDDLPEGELRDAVEAAERHADGHVPIEQVNEFRGRFYGYASDTATPEQVEWFRDRSSTFTLVRMTTYSPAMLQSLSRNENWLRGVSTFHDALPPFLRCIFGNPFWPVAFDPEWRSVTAVALARGIYEDRAWDRLPVLADALDDAGCDQPDVIGHCRGPGPHARGCWVVDLILGKC